MTPQEQIDNIVKTIQARVDSFNEAVPDVEKRLYNKLLQMLKELKIVNGRVVNGVENIDKISKVIPEIEKIIVDAGYERRVANFSQAFDEVAKLQNNYFSSLNVKFKPKKVLTKLLEVNKTWTINKLTNQGISSDFAPAIQQVLERAMVSGAEYSDLTEMVRSYVLSGEAGPGALARYSGQVATDAINFFSANYNETVTADLGLKWRVYTGSLLETSREWCVHMVKKEYVHEAELNDVIFKEIDGVEIGSEELPVNKKTGLPRGMMEGTNADTIKSNRGGHRCGHQWIAVTESMVPLNTRIATYNKYGIKHKNGIADKQKSR